MTLSAISARYANAFADVVTVAGSPLTPQQAISELRAFESVFASSIELRNALITPAVPVGRKRAVVARIADELGLARLTRNFLFVLVDHGRIALVSGILQDFEKTLDERLGFARAEVISAREVTAPQREALSQELERLTGKRVRMRLRVDESLIGGVVARIGSTVYDGSVRGQLQSMGRRLGAES